MADAARPGNFLTEIIDADLAAGRNGGQVVTRFPPEPNGYLHLGHAKSILLNFGLAARYGGRAHLRFDDTNPTTEETEYVEGIQADVRWLAGEWSALHYASSFFEQMYQCAERLVLEGHAYVDSQPQEAIRAQRGDFNTPGVNGPHRDRPAAESLALLRRMRAGEFPDGACVLRARIDMGHRNVLLRDPLLYRIRHASHHRTGAAWCIYPMYDYAHPLEDAFEGVTHSICTLEFESNRELYDWVLDHLGPWDPRPRQYEFARLALGYTVLSKRKLLTLVGEGRVAGWDDPRMPTLAGLRRRGVTPEALRDFAELIGVSKNNSTVDIGKFEYALRADLEARCPRAMAVLDPLPITITSWPVRQLEWLDVPWWPGEPDRGVRQVPFGRELLIERDDFSEDPPADWKRLGVGREVRLAGGYVVRCEGVQRDPQGHVTGLLCTHDPDSLAADPAGRRRVPGVLHWVHAVRSEPTDVRLYDRLFTVEQPDAVEDFRTVLNPDSLVHARGARLEPALAAARPGERFQFLRQGYFHADPVDSRPGAPLFNRIISLKDSWSRVARPEATARPRAAPPPRAGAPRRARNEGRAETRAATPELAERYARYQASLGLPEEQADLLTGDLAVATYFEAALAAHPGAGSLARWLLNDLLGLAREAPLDGLPLQAPGFGAFVALVDAGRVTPAAAKVLLADLAAGGGDPAARLAALGLEKVEDQGALEAALDRALAATAAEVARYRAGERKLLGVILGAAMREAKGADATEVRRRLTERLQ
ncbi:MAG: glutamine--tRNA ligase/YqeY domain fusion protein [Anaeromyxobacter sp.]|nr:glutamine--tRNA ligase/YqeY domain fusion protein [Anaeromyxobacter sp.]MBL0274913.1 glutamine--tRNA ligase/YqeY domain fusion protein [Anaeromyxobacter sp.]